MLFHRCEDAEVALNAPIIIVMNIILDHVDQFFLAGKALAVITFPFQDAPKTLHWTVVNALGHAGHTLGHACLLQLVMEGAVGILKTPVTMKEWMCTRIGFYRLVKGLENQRIIIAVTHYIGNDATVIEIKNRAEIDLVHLNALIPFELCHIGKPFLVWLVRMEFAVKEILGYKLRILRLPRASVVVVFDGGLDTFDPTDAENALVVHMDMFVVPKVVIDAAVALIRTLHVDLLNFLRNLLVLNSPSTLFP